MVKCNGVYFDLLNVVDIWVIFYNFVGMFDGSIVY